MRGVDTATLFLRLSLIAAFLIVLLAVALGISVEIAGRSAIVALILVALLVGAHRYYRKKNERRLALALGGLLSISLAGSAGGVISIVGQAFAAPLIDEQLAGADQFLGLSSVAATALAVRVPGLPEFLGLAYISSIPLIIMSALALAMMDRTDRLSELCAAFAFCMLVTTVTSAIFPAAGAFSYLSMPAELQAALPPGSGIYHLSVLADLRNSGTVKLDAAHLQGLSTFPSFHTSMALMTAAAWRDHWLRWPMFGWNAVVVVSTIPIGGHYFVDLAGGTISWALIFALCAKDTAVRPAPCDAFPATANA